MRGEACQGGIEKTGWEWQERCMKGRYSWTAHEPTTTWPGQNGPSLQLTSCYAATLFILCRLHTTPAGEALQHPRCAESPLDAADTAA